MTVATEPAPPHLGGLHRAEEISLVDVEERLIMVIGPGLGYHEFTDGDTVTSAVLPGFEASFDELIDPAR